MISLFCRKQSIWQAQCHYEWQKIDKGHWQNVRWRTDKLHRGLSCHLKSLASKDVMLFLSGIEVQVRIFALLARAKLMLDLLQSPELALDWWILPSKATWFWRILGMLLNPVASERKNSHRPKASSELCNKYPEIKRNSLQIEFVFHVITGIDWLMCSQKALAS